MQGLASSDESYLITVSGFISRLPRKIFSTVDNREFERFFPEQIREPILSAFFAHHGEDPFLSMHVLRTGFEGGSKDPIVIHILVRWNTLSQKYACALASMVER